MAEDRDSTEVPVTKVVKDRASVGIMVTITHLGKCPAYGKECFRCKKPNHFKEFCRSNPWNRSQSQGGGGRQTCKDMHEVDKEDDPFAMYEYDDINVRTVHFTTNVKYTPNANIAFDEVSSDRKLQCLHTDVTVSNKIGHKTTVHV